MFGKIGEMGNLLKQAQDIKGKMAKLQEELSRMEVVGYSGGERVKVVVGGDMSVKSVAIHPECLNADDAEIVSDMVLTAVNAALAEAKKKSQERMSELTMGIKIPGLFP